MCMCAMILTSSSSGSSATRLGSSTCIGLGVRSLPRAATPVSDPARTGAATHVSDSGSACSWRGQPKFGMKPSQRSRNRARTFSMPTMHLALHGVLDDADHGRLGTERHVIWLSSALLSRCELAVGDAVVVFAASGLQCVLSAQAYPSRR